MNNLLEEDLYAAGKESQYDDHIKRLLSNKKILAYILTHTLKEYQGMKIKDVVPLINCRYAGDVPIDTGLTNRNMGDQNKKIGQLKY